MDNETAIISSEVEKSTKLSFSPKKAFHQTIAESIIIDSCNGYVIKLVQVNGLPTKCSNIYQFCWTFP